MSYEDAHRRTRVPLPLLAAVVVALAASFTAPELQSASAAQAPGQRRITLPIHPSRIDDIRWSDTFGAPRSGGRSHIGVDMMGPKMVPVVAARSGSVSWGRFDNQRGSMLTIRDAEGWEYSYIHFNNDSPGTDDGLATCTETFSERLCAAVGSDGRITRGTRVTEGETLGYLGDGGNAEWTAPHLHFEIERPDGTAINPTASVDAARDGRSAPRNEPPVAEPGDDGFTDHLWSRLHGRNPSNAERERFEDEVADSGVWNAVADEIDETSTASMVDRLYLAFFRRYPDDEGIRYWVESRGSGNSMEDIAEWFALSKEYQARYGNADFGPFLDLLYQDVLGRQPDEDGKSYWLNQLADGEVTRGTIVVYFTESAEMKSVAAHRNEIVSLSMLKTGKAPTMDDVAAWRALRASKSPADAAASWYRAAS